MKLRWIKIGLILAMGTMLCGCWDTIDVEEFEIAVAGGYDTPRSGEEGKVSVSALLAAVEQKNERLGTYSASTIGETRARRAYSESRHYSLAQLQAILIGQDLAQQGVRSVLDTNLREPRAKISIPVAVVNGRTEELLESMIEKDGGKVSENLISLLQTIKKRAFVPQTSLHRFAVGSYTTGIAAAVPVLKTSNNQLGVEVTGCALFSQERMIAELDRIETRSLVLLSGNAAQGWIPFFLYKDGEMVDSGTVFAANQRKVNVSREGDVITFDIKVFLTGRLVEHGVFGHSESLHEEQHLGEIEQVVAGDLRQELLDFVRFMQEELRVDAIDITPYALARWRQEITPQLGNGFIEDVIINVEVDVSIKNTGEIG